MAPHARIFPAMNTPFSLPIDDRLAKSLLSGHMSDKEPGLSETASRLRVLLVDDHALFRNALRKLLEIEPGFELAGEAASAREALELVKKANPDVVLLDLSMPQESGMEVLRRMTDVGHPAKVILLVASIERSEIIECLRLGARGVVLKDSASQTLYKSIRTVMQGQYWIDHNCVADLVQLVRTMRVPGMNATQAPKFGLTARESEILATVVDGYTNKDMAKKFGISEQTVKHHLTSIFEKVGVSNRLELALFAMNNRLISED
jgi:two-component system, NarL family, nitrate/nitrite response regulator NarL